MINDTFFRSYPSRQARSVPVQQAHRNSLPKVVSVPVHFVPSKQPQIPLISKESAALKIQKAFRGFLVRKSVKKISSIRNEVCEVERRVNDTDVAELIRRDAKERLRVNETLMSLLFKLDSIRGVDFGVRDLRKAVTKKAITLQDKVDSVVATKNESAEIDSDNAFSSAIRDEIVDDSVNLAADTDSVMKADEVIDATTEVVKEIDENRDPVEVVDATKKGSAEIDSDNASAFRDEIVDDSVNIAADTDSEMKTDEINDATTEVVKEIDESCDTVQVVDATKNESAEIDSDNAYSSAFRDEIVDDSPNLTVYTDSVMKAGEVIDATIEVVKEIDSDNAYSSAFRDEIVDDSANLAADMEYVMKADEAIDATTEVVKKIDENCDPVEAVDECCADQLNYTLQNTGTEGEGRDDDKKRNVQLLEKLTDDNEKMMTLITQMFERNEMQTRMLNSLSERVKQLEKAFMCDKSRRKKKRHSA